MGKKLSTNIFLILFTIYSEILTSNAIPLMGESVAPAEPNEFPFVVSFGYHVLSLRGERYKNHFCGGSLITKKHVLTAAHCITDEKMEEIVVTVGNVDLNKGKLYTINSWKTYDEWAIENNILAEFPSNDIAIVTLSNHVNHIVPANRSNLPESKIFGKNVITAGWGLLSNGSKPQFLQKASLQVLTDNQCKFNLLTTFGPGSLLSSKNHYCTIGKPPVLLGCGDSGSPLLLKETKEIVGVNEGACEADDNDITNPEVMNMHDKVIYYKEFIDDAVKH